MSQSLSGHYWSHLACNTPQKNSQQCVNAQGSCTSGGNSCTYSTDCCDGFDDTVPLSCGVLCEDGHCGNAQVCSK